MHWTSSLPAGLPYLLFFLTDGLGLGDSFSYENFYIEEYLLIAGESFKTGESFFFGRKRHWEYLSSREYLGVLHRGLVNMKMKKAGTSSYKTLGLQLDVKD